jgi:hypothetical protein
MDLLDKGKHCQEELCHQLSFLPMQCKACAKIFCSEHFKYDAHNCKESCKFDFKVPNCSLCLQPIEFTRDKTIELCLAEHMQKCDSTAAKKKNDSNAKKCSFKNCKSKDLFKIECDNCQLLYCKKHRLPEVHECNNKSTESCAKQFSKMSLNGKSDAETSHHGGSFFTVASF